MSQVSAGDPQHLPPCGCAPMGNPVAAASVPRGCVTLGSPAPSLGQSPEGQAGLAEAILSPGSTR